MGGTGANFIALVTGDVGFYNSHGIPTPPPANQIEDPNAIAGATPTAPRPTSTAASATR